MGEALTYTVAQTVGPKEWTPERAEAWTTLYDVVAHYVNEGLAAAQRDKEMTELKKELEVSKLLLEQARKQIVTAMVAPSISEKEKRLVREIWKIVKDKDPEATGIGMYM